MKLPRIRQNYPANHFCFSTYWPIAMNSGILVFIGFLTCLQTACYASEYLFTLEQKVQTSDVIALGRVTKVELGKIHKIDSQRVQDTTIHFRVEERILGHTEKEILIEAHSVDFQEGNTVHSASAGFLNPEVKEGKRFIAYLKRQQQGFALTGESNQYFEWIDEETKTVRDIGQTARMVPLKSKLEQLQKLSQKATAPVK